MGDGMWPLFWAAAALMITGLAAWGSTMLMRIIDERIEAAVQRVLSDVDLLDERLGRLERELLAPGPEPSDVFDDDRVLGAEHPTPS